MIKQVLLENVEDILPLFDNYRVFYRKASDSKVAKQYLHERLTNKEAVIFGYYQDDQPIAFTLCYFRFSSTAMMKTLQLNDLFVDPDFRNQGIGEQLIQRVFDYAKSINISRVGIETAHDNTGAQRLYERIGFIKETGVHYQKPV